MLSAGGTALDLLLQHGLLVHRGGEQLVLDVIEAQTVDGIGEALSGDALIPEEEDGALDDIQHFLLRGKDLVHGMAVGNALAPAAAQIDSVAVHELLGDAEGALALAAATVVAGGGVDVQGAVFQLGHMDGAVGLHLADLAAAALGGVDHGHTLAHDAQVVQIGLDAVVGAAAHRDLELVGQGDAVVAQVEPLVEFLAQAEGIQQAVLAGGTLAGDDGPHQRAGAASLQTGPGQEGTQVVQFIVGHALDLQRQAGGHSHLAGAVPLGGLGNDPLFLGGDLAVAGDDPDVEAVGVALVLQAAQPLHPLDLLRRDGAGKGHLDLVEEGAAFQHLGVGVAEGFQAVLQKVAALALGAHQQQPGVLGQPLDGAGDGGEVHPLGAGDLGLGLDVDDLVTGSGTGGVFRRGKGFKRAGELVFQNVAGLHKGMDGRGEGRRVGEVQGVEILHLGTHGDAGDGDVHHLVHRTGAQHLDAQQLMGGPVGDELGHKAVGAGIVVGLVVGDADHTHRVKPGVLCLGLGQAGAPGVEGIQQLDHAGAQAAAVEGLVPRQVAGKAPAGDVGGGAHGRPLGFAGKGVMYHGAVAHGVDVGQVGGLFVIHQDGAFEHFEAAALQKRGSRADADGQHHQVRRDGTAVGGNALGFVGAGDALQRRAGEHPHAFGLQLPLDVGGHFGVKDVGHELGGHIHHRDRKALGQQVFGHFQANETAAHHHGAAAGVFIHPVPHGDGIVRRAHTENARQRGAWHIGHKGLGAHGQNQLVIALGLFRAGGGVPQGDGLGPGIQRRGLLPGVDLHPGQPRVFPGRIDDEFLPGFDAAAHIVGQAAARVGNILPFGVEHHLGVGLLALEFGGSLGAGGHAADNENFHTFVLFSGVQHTVTSAI